MSYIRELPTSDDGREAALNVAKQRKDDPNNTLVVFSTKNAADIDIHQPLLPLLRAAFQSAEQTYRQSVIDFDVIYEKFKNKASHGLQLVRFKVVDEDAGWTTSTYSYYLLPKDGHLPPFTTEDEVIQMGKNFINGETARIGDGGIALVDIKKVDVASYLSQINTLRLAKQDAKDAMIDAQMALAEERAIVDTLIESCWGDIEHTSQDMPKSTAHDFDVSWGMKFTHVPVAVEVNVKAEDIVTHEILIGVSLRIGLPKGKGGAKGETNQYGVDTLTTKSMGDTHLIATHPLYEDTIVPIKVEEGKTLNVTVKMKKKNLE
ncbi:MAG: hypothetical protein WCH34_02905 [Bacteroidota bacterium]